MAVRMYNNMCDGEIKLYNCLEQCRKLTSFEPQIAVVLGSGLGTFVEKMQIESVIDYSQINGFPVSTAPDHIGRFVFGNLNGKRIVALQGRVHYYEGYSMQDVVLPIRLANLLGANTAIITNAAGGINTDFCSGDFMLIEDHISSFVPSPLIGENFESLGIRFPDMSNVYDKTLQSVVENCAKKLGINLKRGVLVQVCGPNYETAAEIRLLKSLGADAVGMSTVCEAIAAHHAGMKICGISCISNMACGISQNLLSHKEVELTTFKVKDSFNALLCKIINNIN